MPGCLIFRDDCSRAFIDAFVAGLDGLHARRGWRKGAHPEAFDRIELVCFNTQALTSIATALEEFA